MTEVQLDKVLSDLALAKTAELPKETMAKAINGAVRAVKEYRQKRMLWKTAIKGVRETEKSLNQLRAAIRGRKKLSLAR